jgi:protein-tyrosine kinase
MSVVIPSATRVERRKRFLGLFGSTDGRLRLISGDASSPFAESFRLLALNVQAALAYDARKSLAVMSGYAGDGRSLVAANLALALVEQHPVLLVDDRGHASGGHGSLAERFSAIRGDGFDRLPNEMRRTLGETLHRRVRVVGRPEEGAEPDELDTTIASASDAGMYTIIDTSPALSTSASYQDARLAGNALYVIRGTTTDVEALRRVREQLERLNVNIIGVLVNEH